MNLRHSDFTVNIPNQPYHFLVRVTSTSVKILPCHDKDLPNDNYKIMASVDSLKQLVEDLDTKINNNPSLLGKNARLLFDFNKKEAYVEFGLQDYEPKKITVSYYWLKNMIKETLEEADGLYHGMSGLPPMH